MANEKLSVTANQTFTGQIIRIDGLRFENCKFVRCTIVYHGGIAQASNCEFSPDTMWEFHDWAGSVMRTLPDFGWDIKYGGGEVVGPVVIPQL